MLLGIGIATQRSHAYSMIAYRCRRIKPPGNMKKYLVLVVCVIGALVVCAIGAMQALTQLTANEIQQSHIEGNVPQAGEFEQLLTRDLLAYFTAHGYPQAVRVKYTLLRRNPTQTGVAYPKFYVWVQVYDTAGVAVRGAARLAAIERRGFEITDFMSAESIRAEPGIVGKIFPESLVANIQSLAKAN